MKTFFTTVSAMIVAGSTIAQDNWAVDPVHSSVNFEIGHMLISTVNGKFKEFKGSLTTAGNNIDGGSMTAEISVASVDTGNDGRDSHLRSPDFFAAEKFPKMLFQSTSVKKIDDTHYEFEGGLTIRDITKTVKLAGKLGGRTTVNGKEKMGFRVTGTIDRRDFGITSNASTVGSEVTMVIAVELVRIK